MLIRTKKRWHVEDRDATPEATYVNRRQIMAGGAALAGAGLMAGQGMAQQMALETGPDGGLVLNASRNEKYVLDRPVTPEDINTTYNNFYEYGSHKQISAAAERELIPRPWQIEIDGLVDNPITLDVDDLINRMGVEERLYRLRCVEAWSMTVPWIGFAMSKLVDLAQPQNDARFIRMETFSDGSMASGVGSQPWYPWPYVEGVTMEEARNELAFMVVGAYGKIVPNQMGAPIRLHMPWKFGFKGIKSIVRFSFVSERPVGFWETIQAKEYGFWANVNPKVNHPRWSQATERVLHTDERVPTLLYNGYGEEVAGLYAGMQDLGRTLYM
jgi:methionine sulfoxide reductase catalytic subunit